MKAMKLLKLKDVPCRSDDLGWWQESVRGSSKLYTDNICAPMSPLTLWAQLPNPSPVLITSPYKYVLILYSNFAGANVSVLVKTYPPPQKS